MPTKMGWSWRSAPVSKFPQHLSTWENKIECKKAKENPWQCKWGVVAMLLPGCLTLLFNGLFCLIYEEEKKTSRK